MPARRRAAARSRRAAVSRKSRKGSARTAARGKRRPITAEDLTRFLIVSDPQTAPGGERVVFVRKHVGTKNDYVTDLWMVGTAAGAEPARFTSGGKDGHPRWSPDGARIAFLSGRDKGRPQIWSIPATGGEATRLTDFPEGTIASFAWSPDGSMLAVSFREQDPDWTEAAGKNRTENGLSDPPRVLDDWWYRLDGDGYFNAQRFRLYVVDAESGAHRLLYGKDNLGGFTYSWSPDSKELAVSTNTHPRAHVEPWRDTIVRVDVKSGRIRELPNLPIGPKFSVKWSPDGKFIAWVGREGETGSWDAENMELFVSSADKGGAKNLTRKSDYCLTAATLADTAEAAFDPQLFWAPNSRRLYFRVGWHGEGHLASVARSGGEVTLHTSGALEHGSVTIDRKGTLAAMTVGGPTSIGEVHVGRVVAGKMTTRALTAFNAALLKEIEIAKPTSHWVRSADGHRVQVWGIRPLHGKRKVPAILEVHGGPHAQYGVPFFHEFQLLAAQGYAVFYSNPRGSKGYGAKHCAAIKGDWGNKDWIDIQAAVDFMKSQSWVDTKRLGIMGGSYGGYMTNWAIGHSRDFKAAITDRCVSNLVSMMGSTDFVEPPDHYWPGNIWDRPEQLWAMSPIAYFGRVKTPLLIIHSEGDLRCNIEQAEQIFTVLKFRKVPCRFVRYPRSTSHGMSRGGPPDMRLHRLGQILEWWKKYL
jgi:dipeptidyl aminopeptidase/acylaminoacyl peptidase